MDLNVILFVLIQFAKQVKFDRLMNANISIYLLLLINMDVFGQINADTICPTIPVFEVEKNLDFFDKAVIGDFKVWQLAFMTAACGLVLTIVLCCIFRCRIPRTKQEIEASFVRRRITKQFRKHLNKIPIKDVELSSVLPLVLNLEESRLQRGYVDEKKSLKDRIFALFGSNGSVEKQSSIEEELPSEEMQNKYDALKHQISIEFTDTTESNENALKEAVDQICKAEATVETGTDTVDTARDVSSENEILKCVEKLSSLKEPQKSRKLFKQFTKTEEDIESGAERTEKSDYFPST